MAVAIAICALVFTIASFWYLNLFPGRVSGIPAHIFAGHASATRGLLRLPIVIYNSGAIPKVVTEMQLILTSGDECDKMPTQAVRFSLDPKPDDRKDFFHAFVVPGRSVITQYVDFQAQGAPRAMVTGEPSEARVEMRLGTDARWKTLCISPLRTDSMADPGLMITYSNSPAHWPDRQLERAAVALAGVRSGIPGKRAGG